MYGSESDASITTRVAQVRLSNMGLFTRQPKASAADLTVLRTEVESLKSDLAKRTNELSHLAGVATALDSRLEILDGRLTSMTAELTHQLHELGSELESLADKDPDNFAKIWDAFGAVLKEGIYEDFERREKLLARLGQESADAIEEFLSLTLAHERVHSPSLEGFLDWLQRGEIATGSRNCSSAVCSPGGPSATSSVSARSSPSRCTPTGCVPTRSSG